MPIRKAYVVECNKINCSNEETIPAKSKNQAHESLHHMGWLIHSRNGRIEHVCPDCFDKMMRIAKIYDDLTE